MSTLQTLHRCETRTVSIDAAPEVVLDLVADPRNLPVWAPRFARSVRRGERDGRWLVDNGQREFPIEIRIAREQGTVDLLDAADPRRGAFTRVVPNAHGSEYLFTLLFADGTPPVAIDEQMRTVEAELATVRELSESALRRGPEPGRATTTPGPCGRRPVPANKEPTMDPRIDVITLAVADLDQALAFYRDGLGLESRGVVASEFAGDDVNAAGAIVQFKLHEHLMLALYPRTELAKDAGIELGPPKPGEFSLGQLVGSRAEVDALLAQAEAAGAVITNCPHDRPWGIYSGYFRDPDGHVWEIIHNP